MWDLRNRRTTVYAGRHLVVQFEMDRKGIAKCAVGQDLASATRQVVRERAMPYAIRISPIGQRDDDGGKPRYVESFRISQGFTVIAGMRRVASKLTNIAPHAAAVEFTGNNPHASGHGVLRKTLAHLNGTGATLREAKSPWRPELHPRGAGGRFISKSGPATSIAKAVTDAVKAQAKSAPDRTASAAEGLGDDALSAYENYWRRHAADADDE